jgi:hypothetical protein
MGESKFRKTAHLVGSIGLDSVEDVFATVGPTLGAYLRRIPDGEVGGRKIWISWQYPLLRAQPFLVPDPSGAVRPTNRFPLLCLADGVKSEDARFGELNYSREARASYLDFIAARDTGLIATGVRFQVCLPTPFAVVSSVVVPNSIGLVESAYEKAMLEEVARICRHIPHDDLCIQWDVCNEMVIWDGQPTKAVPYGEEPREKILARMARLCRAVPGDVELGLHLCYGDFDGRHFVEPKDAGAMVEFANALAAASPHKLAYVHMPVPPERDDDAFHLPFRRLALGESTELYLGVVSARDGAEGARRRIAAASRHAPPFGIATECGMARARTRETVRKLLDIHTQICAEA